MTLPVSVSTSAYARSPSSPLPDSSTLVSLSPCIDLTGNRDSVATVPTVSPLWSFMRRTIRTTDRDGNQAQPSCGSPKGGSWCDGCVFDDLAEAVVRVDGVRLD